MNTETVLFPMCGITYGHVAEVAARADNKRDAAQKLGISERQFYQVVKDKGLDGLFELRKPRQRCVTREEIIDLAQQGFIRRDAAFMLNISVAYLKELIHLWGLQDYFTVTHGRASWVARRGYIEN